MAFITGYSGRFPSSDNIKDFWDALLTGTNVNIHSFLFIHDSLMYYVFYRARLSDRKYIPLSERVPWLAPTTSSNQMCGKV